MLHYFISWSYERGLDIATVSYASWQDTTSVFT